MTYPISTVELLRDLLQNEVDPAIVKPGHIVAGPLDATMLLEGGVSIVDAGAIRQEKYLPLLHVRIQVRAMAESLATSEMIGRHIFEILHQRTRKLITQPSTDKTYLAHWIDCLTGQSTHYDSPQSWEQLFFVEMIVGTEAV